MPHSQAQQSLNAVHFTLPWEFEWMPLTIPILCGFINSAHWGFFYFIFVLIPPVSKFKEFSRHCSSPSPTGWLFENLDPWKCSWVSWSDFQTKVTHSNRSLRASTQNAPHLPTCNSKRNSLLGFWICFYSNVLLSSQCLRIFRELQVLMAVLTVLFQSSYSTKF